MEEQTKSVLAEKKSDYMFCSGIYGEIKRMAKGLQDSQGKNVEPR